MGNYVHRVARAPLATADRKGRPVLTKAPAWPITVKNGAGHDDPDAQFVVSIARREEKAAMSTSLLTCCSTSSNTASTQPW